MKVRFLADANFNQKIVAGLLLREPAIDFALPQAMIPERMKDPDILDFAHFSGRIVVSHDVTTMPHWFNRCVKERNCAGLILVPEKVPIRDVIEDFLLIWHLTEAEEWRTEWSGFRCSTIPQPSTFPVFFEQQFARRIQFFLLGSVDMWKR